uniref:CUB domain-containing protein n=1 Tax=Pundamilia nyererei TaxID=303518 RepID=A0A3B4GSC0_9CICH
QSSTGLLLFIYRICVAFYYSGAENTFFALRSCHRLLYSDSGEFFSPDYLCSNPPLWCNWTIQVDPSKRIHLYLEDLTPDDICNLKQDQIHIDEPVGDLAGHKVLQKCWQEAKYTTSSNILYVVLLISGWPNPLYRGFYGRYQAFGSPVIYNPGEGFTETSNESETSPGLMDFSESGPGTKKLWTGVFITLNLTLQRLNLCHCVVCFRLNNETGSMDHKAALLLRYMLRYIITGFVHRLHAGVLYILWLQVRQGPRGMHVHRSIHSALQGLIEVDAGDVNECGTQLAQCDFNADCVNQFGSYSCHCRAGFQDNSRLGSGGTICVDMKAAGCSSRLSTEAKGVYVLFFLLSSLILALLVVAGMFYHRHHRGKFLVRCHSNSSLSPSDPNNNHQHPEENYSNPADSDPPPPSPPAWGPRECWGHVKEQRQVVDLQLLRFNLLHPPDHYMDQQEGVNSQ